MRDQDLTAQATADELAPECLYRFLSAVVAGPYSAHWARASDVENRALVLGAWQWLQPETEEFEMIRLIRELEASLQVLRAQYDSVFGLVVPKECPPYETEYYPTPETFGR